MMIGRTMKTIGTVMFPFILTKKDTGERMRYVLHAHVLPDLFMPMFISFGGVAELVSMGGGEITFEFKCRNKTCLVEGIPHYR